MTNPATHSGTLSIHSDNFTNLTQVDIVRLMQIYTTFNGSDASAVDIDEILAYLTVTITMAPRGMIESLLQNVAKGNAFNEIDMEGFVAASILSDANNLVGSMSYDGGIPEQMIREINELVSSLLPIVVPSPSPLPPVPEPEPPAPPAAGPTPPAPPVPPLPPGGPIDPIIVDATGTDMSILVAMKDFYRDFFSDDFYKSASATWVTGREFRGASGVQGWEGHRVTIFKVEAKKVHGQSVRKLFFSLLFVIFVMLIYIVLGVWCIVSKLSQ